MTAFVCKKSATQAVGEVGYKNFELEMLGLIWNVLTKFWALLLYFGKSIYDQKTTAALNWIWEVHGYEPENLHT